jgi:Kef-type K+ transport system membrane component KefB
MTIPGAGEPPVIDALFAIFLGLAVIASIISAELGLSVAIVEIVIGLVAGNAFGVTATGHDWLPFLAALGSLVLTFLAGVEIDPDAMRRQWRESLLIGGLSFLVPVLAAWLFCWFALQWTMSAALLGGVALSTTSVAVVYVVLLESNLSKTDVGKIILSSCFVTDFGTAAALSILFAPPNDFIFIMIVATAAAIVILPRLLRLLLARSGGKTSEPGVRILFVSVALLGITAEAAGSHAALPAYILGLALARTLDHHRETTLHFRTLAFSFLTPAFFIYAGLRVSMFAVIGAALVVAALFLVKVGAKFASVYGLTQRYVPQAPMYTTLLMSTGLTFGTISATFGLDHGIITQNQFSVLVIVVILTAVVPTLIAQKWFDPRLHPRTESVKQVVAPSITGGAPHGVPKNPRGR